MNKTLINRFEQYQAAQQALFMSLVNALVTEPEPIADAGPGQPVMKESIVTTDEPERVEDPEAPAKTSKKKTTKKKAAVKAETKKPATYTKDDLIAAGRAVVDMIGVDSLKSLMEQHDASAKTLPRMNPETWPGFIADALEMTGGNAVE